MRSTRRSVAIVIISFVTVAFCTGRSVSAAGADSSPWLLPENAGKYIFIGPAVWDIDEGKMVSQTGAPKGLAGEDASIIVRRVPGVNDGLFICPVDPHAPPGTGGIGWVLKYDGQSQQAPAAPEQALKNSMTSQPCVWASPDHRRVVWIQGGDYWRGDLDWTNYKIINAKQVTSLGVFNATNVPELWWGQLLFVNGNFDKAKPVVRIDLATGTTDELEDFHAIAANSAMTPPTGSISPGGCRVVYVTRATIECFDARTGKRTTFHNKFEDATATRGRDLLNATVPPIWTDDDTLYVCSLGQISYLVKLDFRNSRMEFVVPPGVAPNNTIGGANTQFNALLPGGHLIDFTTHTGGGKESQTVFAGRQLLDVTTGKTTKTPVPDRVGGKWISDTQFLYVRTEGGLSGIGTWLYDRESGSNKRLSGVQIDEGRMLIYPKRKQVIAISQQSGSNLVRLNLDGSPSQTLGPCGLSVPMRMPEQTLDLRTAIATEDLWKPAVFDVAAMASTQPAEAAVGKVKLMELLKDRSPEDRKFAGEAYDYMSMNAELSEVCDPVKWAMKALEAHNAEPNSPMSNIAFKIGYADAWDRDRITQYGHDHAATMLMNDSKLTDDQRQQIADRTGPILAEQFFKAPKRDVNVLGTLQGQALKQARAEVLGQSTPASASPQHANAQPTNQNNDNNQSPQQPEQHANQQKQDKASKNIKKAKDAADKLKGLFGH